MFTVEVDLATPAGLQHSNNQRQVMQIIRNMIKKNPNWQGKQWP